MMRLTPVAGIFVEKHGPQLPCQRSILHAVCSFEFWDGRAELPWDTQ